MAAVLWLLAPLLVVAAMWFLLTAYDDSSLDRRRQVRLGAACLAAAVVLTAVGAVLDQHSPAKTSTTSTTGV
ncbi:MAG: hypothetical protein JWP14_409 [Frankiales bacterium]|jgi:hypothetical protein|nr:hypothetical protein [Frankiales bacterium]